MVTIVDPEIVDEAFSKTERIIFDVLIKKYLYFLGVKHKDYANPLVIRNDSPLYDVIANLLRGYKDGDKDFTYITAEEHANLSHAYTVLTALQACGVDNWEGYSIAMDMVE